MIVRDVGILGTGVWEGEIVGNDRFAAHLSPQQVKDPFRGHRDDSGAVSIAGMTFTKAEHPRTIAAIERSFADPYRGTRRRRLFGSAQKVSDAETEAARNAISDAGLSPDDIDAVLMQSFLPDEMHPKNAALVAHNLGIKRAPAWEVDSICNSVITQMTVGASMISAGFAKNILCVQSVAYSRVSDPGSSSTVQEADMAAAFVLGPTPSSLCAFSWRTDGRLHGAIRLEWTAPSGQAPRRYWERSQERFLIRFDPALQPQVMGELRDYARTVCQEALERAGLRIDQIDAFVSHQPMSWYAAFMSDSLGLRDGVSFDTFEEYASINSVSISASLHHARRVGHVGPGKNVLLFGPAAGYTYGAAAIRWGTR